jgi:hypothetical protein
MKLVTTFRNFENAPKNYIPISGISTEGFSHNIKEKRVSCKWRYVTKKTLKTLLTIPGTFTGSNTKFPRNCVGV